MAHETEAKPNVEGQATACEVPNTKGYAKVARKESARLATACTVSTFCYAKVPAKVWDIRKNIEL